MYIFIGWYLLCIGRTIKQKIDTLDFYHHWRQYSDKGGTGEFADFSPAVAMAKEGRFYVSNPNKPDLFSSSDYALHFDAAKVANFLKKYSINNGVNYIKANLERVNKKHLNQYVSMLLTWVKKGESLTIMACKVRIFTFSLPENGVQTSLLFYIAKREEKLMS